VSLTQTEAEVRAALLDVSGYQVYLQLPRDSETFRSTTRISFTCSEPGAETFVEIACAELLAAELNGVVLDPGALTEDRLPLSGLSSANRLVVTADIAYSNTGDGMVRYDDPLDGEVYLGAYLGMDLAHRVFACFDQVDLKAPISLTVQTEPERRVVANSPGEEQSPGVWSFDQTPPMSTYLFTVIAGPWHTITREHDGVAFDFHARQSLAATLEEQVDEMLAVTTACFTAYRSMFSEPYVWGRYGQAFVPGLNWGALEAPGCVLLRDELLFTSESTLPERTMRSRVIAHEMAHMWFGNLVTMRWWDDTWLSESFADYMGYRLPPEVTGFGGTWTQFSLTRKVGAYVADARRTTHPIAPEPGELVDTDTALTYFDAISYAKGASALRQLAAFLGADGFLAGVNLYLARFRFGNATLDDLVDALAEASGEDVRRWADLWLRSTGADVLTVLRAAGSVRLVRSGSRVHRIDVGRYRQTPDGIVAVGRVAVLVDAQETALGDPIGDDELLLVNDGDLSYLIARPDEHTWSVLTKRLSELPDPLARAVGWVTARQLLLDSQISVSAYLDLVASQLVVERDPMIAESVLAHLAAVVLRQLAPTEYLAAAARIVYDSASRIAEVDGLRVVGLRTCLAVAPREEAATLTGWLAGGELDQDLRWRALVRLSELGEIGEDEIVGETRRDPTDLGSRFALQCRTALPSVAAKAEAWRGMFDSEDRLSNRFFYACASGFWVPEQSELLRPWVSRYFEEAPELAARRGSTIAATIGSAGFPSTLAEPATVELGETALLRSDLAPALRREWSDQLDDLARAGRIRAFEQAQRE
jgi:aminopeptidase N